MNDLISKQDALELVRDVCDAIMSCCGSHYDEETKDEVYDDIREVDAILKCNKEIRIALKNMPSAQPDYIMTEWCTDCSEYDQERHCCPRFNKVIRTTLQDAQPEIVRCCKCGFWDRDTLRHQFNDFRDWNEAECKILAERDPYHEINRYTEADDYCSYAERREE